MINKKSTYHGNKRTLGFILLLLASTRCSDAREQDAPPVYEVAHPAAVDIQKRSGSESLANLRTLAAQEGTIDRLWGRNCFTRAMDSLGVAHCRTMTPETASRLALALANCHLGMLGQRQHSCSQKTSLHECTEAFPDDRSFEAYMAQLSHIDSICLYHMHDNFGVRTEELMHKLFDTSSEALKASATIGSALLGVNKQLSSMGGVLSGVHQQQEQLSSLGQATLAQSQLINNQVADIQGGLQAVQTAGDLLLERSSNTLKSIAELDVKEMQRHRQNTQLWQEAKTDALAFHGALQAMREREEHSSQQLSDHLRDLAMRSEGLLQRVNTVVELQQKANQVLVHLLGAQYTLGDVMYYGSGLSTALLMSMQPATRAARVPLVAILLANWGAEYWLLQFLKPHLELDAAGDVFAAVPQPRFLSSALSLLQYYRGQAASNSAHQFDAQEHSFNGLPDSTRLRFSVKSLVRKVCVGLALIATAWALLLHSRAASLGRLREAQHDREVAEILQRMQRAERHERLMRSKINRVLAELRGAQPQKGPRQLGIARAQEQNGLSLREAGPLRKGGSPGGKAKSRPAGGMGHGSHSMAEEHLAGPMQNHSPQGAAVVDVLGAAHVADTPPPEGERAEAAFVNGAAQLERSAGAVAGGEQQGHRAASVRRRLEYPLTAQQGVPERDRNETGPPAKSHASSVAPELGQGRHEVPAVNTVEGGALGVEGEAADESVAPAGVHRNDRLKRGRDGAGTSRSSAGAEANAAKRGRLQVTGS